MAVLNTQKFDHTEKMAFFDGELGMQRYDTIKYRAFDKLTDKQLGFFWRPEEVDILKDAKDFKELTENERHVFTSNLKRQILLDSVQGRAPAEAFNPITSLPELENWITTWTFSETIHSRSYTYIMKNVYPDPTAVLDTIIETPEIMARAKTVTEAYDKFITYAHKYHLDGKGSEKELKKLLYLTLVNVNILEGIRFYVSFACSFAFGELKLMEGSAKIISLIARDENLHLAVSQNIINNYRRNEGDKDMLDIIKETEQEVYDMYDTAVQQEKEWAKFLFKDGSMIGLNDTLLNQYVEFMANKRMKAIGLKGPYDQPTNNNPLPWTTHWLNSRGLQNAPQETEIESYVVGGIKQDVEKETFKGFKL